VTVCELETHPDLYDGKLVSVRGIASLGFENFSLHDPACQLSPYTPRVWLEYGGRKELLMVDCCGNQKGPTGTDLLVQGQEIPLVRDAALDEFQSYLQAFRPKKPDGRRCYLEVCAFYKVTATLTGRFFAGKTETSPNGTQYLHGYGHMGCCHLLIIQQVSAVSATRTNMPAGVEFACSSDTWEPAPEEAKTLTDSQPCSDPWQCMQKRFGKIAAHWGDKIDSAEQAIGGTDFWVLPNGLSAYFVREERPSKKVKSVGPSRISILRQFCRPVSSEPASTGRIVCDRESWSAKEDKAGFHVLQDLAKKGERMLVVNGRRASWDAVEWATKQWKTLPGSSLNLDGCGNLGIGKHRAGYCDWSSPDGMQSVTVRLEIMKNLRWDQDPWVATRVDAILCHAGK